MKNPNSIKKVELDNCIKLMDMVSITQKVVDIGANKNYKLLASFDLSMNCPVLLLKESGNIVHIFSEKTSMIDAYTLLDSINSQLAEKTLGEDVMETTIAINACIEKHVA